MPAGEQGWSSSPEVKLRCATWRRSCRVPLKCAPWPRMSGRRLSKSALEQLSRVLAAELVGSGVRLYVVDPGDMNTEMHRQAEPGVDLSRLPGPHVPAPAFVHLAEEETASFGRFEALKIARMEAQASAVLGR